VRSISVEVGLGVSGTSWRMLILPVAGPGPLNCSRPSSKLESKAVPAVMLKSKSSKRPALTGSEALEGFSITLSNFRMSRRSTR